MKVVPKRKAFFTGLGLRSSEIRRLEETVHEQYLLVKAQWAWTYEKVQGRPVVDEGAATYVLRREQERAERRHAVERADEADEV